MSVKTDKIGNFGKFLAKVKTDTENGKIVWATSSSNSYTATVEDTKILVSELQNSNGQVIVMTGVRENSQDNFSTHSFPKSSEVYGLIEDIYSCILIKIINSNYFKDKEKPSKTNKDENIQSDKSQQDTTSEQ